MHQVVLQGASALSQLASQLAFVPPGLTDSSSPVESSSKCASLQPYRTDNVPRMNMLCTVNASRAPEPAFSSQPKPRIHAASCNTKLHSVVLPASITVLRCIRGKRATASVASLERCSKCAAARFATPSQFIVMRSRVQHSTRRVT
jgi:hypothetical protein